MIQDVRAIGEQLMRALDDPAVFGPFFAPAESWAPWRAFLRAFFALPLSDAEMALFTRCTGRRKPFTEPVTECWALSGRRSGKSRTLALLAVALATMRDYTAYRSPGERIVIPVLAADRDQADVILSYARALVTGVPMLADLLESETADTLELRNGVTLGVYTSSYRSIRGRSFAAVLGDEASFWKSDESRNPAAAVLAAVRPGLATIPGAPLIVATSTYDRAGPPFEAFERHHGHDESAVMVWKADTATMNPSFRQSVIDAAYAADALSAAAEYGSEFRSDVAAAFPDDLIDSAVCRGRRSLPPSYGVNYAAFVDVSGGSRDSAVCGVAHKERDRAVIDRLVTFRAPFNPEESIATFCQVLAGYKVLTVFGDAYASGFTTAVFQRHGVTYRKSALDKSALYREFGQLLSAGVVELLDDSRLLLELRQLERRPARNGRPDQIDHRPGGFDDVANAAAGAVVAAIRYWADSYVSTEPGFRPQRPQPSLTTYDPYDPEWREKVSGYAGR